MHLPGRIAFAATTAITVAATLSACSSPERQPTPTAIVREATEPERIEGVVPVSDHAFLWVTPSDDILIQTTDIERTHPFTLAGRTVSFSEADSSLDPVISEDGRVVAIPVRASDGSGGVALVRDDGYNMTLHLYGGPDAVLGSVKFMPEFGLTLLSVLDADSESRVMAFNNYGIRQFDLPVSDFTGTLRYSPEELRYMVIDRRPLVSEIELIPFDDPGGSTLFNLQGAPQGSEDLYFSVAAIIADWR